MEFGNCSSTVARIHSGRHKNFKVKVTVSRSKVIWSKTYPSWVMCTLNLETAIRTPSTQQAAHDFVDDDNNDIAAATRLQNNVALSHEAVLHRDFTGQTHGIPAPKPPGDISVLSTGTVSCTNTKWPGGEGGGGVLQNLIFSVIFLTCCFCDVLL